MIDRLLPARLDGTYLGRTVALWMFAVVLLLRLLMSGNVIFNGAYVATRADGVPLASYPPAAARTVVALFGIWGIGQAVLCLLGGVALWRYRGMVPLMLAALLLEQLSRRAFLHFVPIDRTSASSANAVNLGLLALTVLALLLSLWGPGTATAADPGR